MTVCFFGIYDPNYSRNAILIKGLRLNGLKVIECNATTGRIKKYFSLAAKLWRLRRDYDAMVVAFPGYQAVILAKLLTRKPVILDAFFSIYDSEVLDRRATRRFSPAALYYWLLDWLSCSLADKVLLDTYAHADYFNRLFKIKKEKFVRVLLGADDQEIKTSAPPARGGLLVHFHGIATPLQGADVILAAARLLKGENIRFNLVGSKIRKRHGRAGDEASINFLNTMPYAELIKTMSQADVCLGIFGISAKTSVVIPNKVYEALAAGRPVITADTPAARELLTDGENCLLCRAGAPADLAEKIKLLASDAVLRRRLGANGHRLFIDKLTPAKVTSELAGLIKDLATPKLIK